MVTVLGTVNREMRKKITGFCPDPRFFWIFKILTFIFLCNMHILSCFTPQKRIHRQTNMHDSVFSVYRVPVYYIKSLLLLESQGFLQLIQRSPQPSIFVFVLQHKKFSCTVHKNNKCHIISNVI